MLSPRQINFEYHSVKTGNDMDQNAQDSLKTLLQQWVDSRQQSLLEKVMVAWSDGIAQLAPDDSLIDSLAAALPEPEPLQVLVPAPAPPGTDVDLGQALERLEAAHTQGEVLKQLLDGLQLFAERSALYVLKQGLATLYAHRGFGTPGADAKVLPPQELEELIRGRIRLVDAPGPAYDALLTPLGAFPAAEVRLIPLRLRRKIVALLLVDSGLGTTLQHPSHLRALALAAEAQLSWLAGAKDEERSAAAPEPPSILTQRVPEAADEAAPAPATFLDPKVRSNAERSARVLVGDIELYFPAKVVQGQQQGSLYATLRDELDRSRASFVERYGLDVENQHRIFYQTVVQQLCEGDPSRLGPAPWAAL